MLIENAHWKRLLKTLIWNAHLKRLFKTLIQNTYLKRLFKKHLNAIKRYLKTLF